MPYLTLPTLSGVDLHLQFHIYFCGVIGSVEPISMTQLVSEEQISVTSLLSGSITLMPKFVQELMALIEGSVALIEAIDFLL